MLPGLVFAKVLERLPRPEDGCWIWPGSVNSHGYGKVTLWGVGTFYTHRIMFGLRHGCVPPEIDHLCRNRRCARPSHLESVSHTDNCDRGAGRTTGRCKAGHVLEEVGWWVHGNGGRKCKACHRERALQSYYRGKARRT